jgi:hypothetical protein
VLQDQLLQYPVRNLANIFSTSVIDRIEAILQFVDIKTIKTERKEVPKNYSLRKSLMQPQIDWAL